MLLYLFDLTDPMRSYRLDGLQLLGRARHARAVGRRAHFGELDAERRTAVSGRSGLLEILQHHLVVQRVLRI